MKTTISKIITGVVLLLIGAIIGASIFAIYLDFISNKNKDISIGTIANVLIAAATIVAVVINYSSIKSQKENRRWEINKDLLITLSTSLSDVIKHTSELQEVAFNDMQGIPQEKQASSLDATIYTKFKRTLAHTTDVYGVLLNDDINNSIQEYIKTEKKIDKAFDDSSINEHEAYDLTYGAQNTLLKILNANIKKYASI